MSLKLKIAVILFFILGLFSLLNVVIQQRAIYPSFVELEKSEAQSNISRVSSAFESEQNHLELFCKDWALWDDSYDFLQEFDQNFVDDNLMYNTFEDNSLFHISYYLNDETIVFSKSYNIELVDEEENSELKTLIPLFIRQITEREGPIPDRGISGILNTEVAPIILTIQPVMNSDRTFDSPGVLVMAKYINSEIIDVVEEQVEVRFTLKMVSNISSAEENDLSIEDNGDTYIVSQYVPTVEDGKVVEFSTLYPRTISQRGKRSIFTAQIIMALTMIVLMTVIHRMITRIIINPIRRVTEAARKIRLDNDYSHTISKNSHDEIGSMISELNGMVDTIRLQTEELHALARVDGLTGLYNRRTLDELMEVEWFRMNRDVQPLSILLIDIDNFKKFNDHFGHPKGDTTLKRVAEVLGKTLKRTSDAATRYGGEEFCIILPNTDENGAITVAERICSEIRDLKIKQSVSIPLPIITVSIGTATAFPIDRSSVDELIEKADNALYQAKEFGRNCCRSAE